MQRTLCPKFPKRASLYRSDFQNFRNFRNFRNFQKFPKFPKSSPLCFLKSYTLGLDILEILEISEILENLEIPTVYGWPFGKLWNFLEILEFCAI